MYDKEELKTIEFGEEDLGDLESLKKRLFDAENDPKSNSYKRILSRPKIAWVKIIAVVIGLSACIIALYYLLRHWSASVFLSLALSLLFLLIFAVVHFKKIVITAVKIYQRYAPSSLRNKCRFEPSCSEYMILAIEKYGVLRGLKKGVGRLKRCNINGGGIDYP